MSSAKKYNNPNWRGVKKSPTQIKVGSILPEEDRLAQELRLAACICHRKQTAVRCNVCGSLVFGRMYRQCTVHTNVVFLYDMRNCPKCGGPNKHLEELPIDIEAFEKIMKKMP